MERENPFASPRFEEPRALPIGTLRSAFGIVLLRAWTAFSAAAFAAAVALTPMCGDNLLRSDDSYILGGIGGAFCTAFAFLHSLVKVAGGTAAWQRLAYFGPLVACAAFFLSAEIVFPPPEGQGIPTLLGLLAGISGAICYPLLAIPLTRTTLACLSIPGLLYLLGYGFALFQVSSQGWL